jgi:hypothetical protein
VLRPPSQRIQQRGDPGRDAVCEVGRTQPLVGRDRGAFPAAVDLGHADGAEQIARDRRVRAAGNLHLDVVQRDTVHLAGGLAQGQRVLAGGLLQQRAVDVEEQ